MKKLLIFAIPFALNPFAFGAEEIKVSQNRPITLKADSCPQGYWGAIKVLPPKGFPNHFDSNTGPNYQGTGFQESYPLTNKLRVSVKCVKMNCVLATAGVFPWQDSYHVALELEDGVTTQYLSKYPVSKVEAQEHIKYLLDEKVCAASRKRGKGYGATEVISPYQEGFEHNIN